MYALTCSSLRLLLHELLSFKTFTFGFVILPPVEFAGAVKTVSENEVSNEKQPVLMTTSNFHLLTSASSTSALRSSL